MEKLSSVGHTHARTCAHVYAHIHTHTHTHTKLITVDLVAIQLANHAANSNDLIHG